MVEFVLVASVLVPLFLGILQLGILLHVRNTMQAEAAEGARYAAAADRSPAQGAARARDLAIASFGTGLDPRVTSGQEVVDGLPTVWVRVEADLPLVGWAAGLRGGISVTAHALEEGP